MRHGHGLRKLNRTSSHRLAMLQNMMNSLIEHEAIKTTLPKAKELRRVIEPMLTLGKEPTLANKRLAFNRLRNRDNVVKLFAELGPRYKTRPGGYTRILKTGNRAGDNADMAMIELVDFNEFFDGFNADKKKTTTRRSRRSGSATSTTAAAPKATAKVEAAEEIQDAVVVEETPATPIFGLLYGLYIVVTPDVNSPDPVIPAPSIENVVPAGNVKTSTVPLLLIPICSAEAVSVVPAGSVKKLVV